MVQFANLFESGRIGKLQLKNRIISSPVLSRYASEDGSVSDRMIDYYTERARGGCGLVIVESSYPRRYPGRISLYDDRFIPGLGKLAKAIHDAGAKVAIQINPHRGRADEVDPASASEATHPKTGIKARAMSIADIQKLEEEVAQAAARVKRAGFDCIMIHGGSGYIISEFLSPRTNKRLDDYGGDTRKRAKFALELVAAVKKMTGLDYPVIFRMTADERVEGGFGLEDAIILAKLLEEAGADAIDVVSGVAESFVWIVPYMYLPDASNAFLSQTIKREVRIPVCVSGNINNPNLAEEVLKKGKADFISLCRALISDPQFPNKVIAGKVADICKCIGCCRCIESVLRPPTGPLVCSVNPAVGSEREFELGLKPTTKKKRVLVIGGGPGGMEAALVAATRQHDVTLWERSDRLGGQLNVASNPPGKEKIKSFVDYLTHQLNKLNVTVRFGKEATAEAVLDFSPDVVILAVGATPFIPRIKGSERKKLVFFNDALSGKIDVGERVIVIGGGFVGCETADFLAERGKNVTVIEILPELAAEIFYPYADLLTNVLAEKGVKVFIGVKEEMITERELQIRDRKGNKISLQCDDVVIATGSVANRTLFESIRGKVSEVYEVGDCIQARRIQEATSEGARAALRI